MGGYFPILLYKLCYHSHNKYFLFLVIFSDKFSMCINKVGVIIGIFYRIDVVVWVKNLTGFTLGYYGQLFLGRT